jgi:hypothetical protein
MRSRVGFARPWWALDEQVTAIQSLDRVDCPGDLIGVLTNTG